MNNVIQVIINKLNEFRDKNITISQTGFLESKFVIQKMTYKLEEDILYILNDTKNIFININVNQIYDIKVNQDSMLIYLDNDTSLKLKI